jgi:membrane-associated phospholipid phosphatase
MTVFFELYFRILKHPIFPVTIMPVTAVDRFVGFQPAGLSLYLSLWVYVTLACVLVKNRRELLSYGAAAATLSVVGLGIFFLWPTAVPQLADTDWSRYPSFAFLKTVDASGNACPSLHVAFAVFTAIRLGRLLRELGAPQVIRGGSWLWCLGIVYSTLATRQHVTVDALAGALLGAIVATPQFRLSTVATAVGSSAKGG